MRQAGRATVRLRIRTEALCFVSRAVCSEKIVKMDGRTRKRSGISEALSACVWQEACAMIERLLRQRKVFIKVNEYYCGR